MAPQADLGAALVSEPAVLSVSRFVAPPAELETVLLLARGASIDVGGVEFLVSKADGRIYYYDVNSTSNFVANAPAVVGFDPTARFVDFIESRARREARPAAA